MKLWEETRRFLMFNAVGMGTALVGIPLMALLDWVGVPYLIYTGVNYLVCIGLGFWLNFKFSFGDREISMGTALVRYLIGFLSLLAFVLLLQYVLIDVAHWPRWTGVGLGIVAFGGIGYLISQFWAFKVALKEIPVLAVPLP